MPSVLPAAHRALVLKVDAFDADTRARAPDAYACRKGCSACCRVELSVCDVEAQSISEALAQLPTGRRLAIAARAEDENGACVFLRDDGACEIYEGRPLVCRTQGLALRYPSGWIPAEAIKSKRSDGDVTYCPLNFESRPPLAAEVLDAERVDLMLALSNREAGGDDERRHRLRDLARQTP
jgi:uncharacterized protein